MELHETTWIKLPEPPYFVPQSWALDFAKFFACDRGGWQWFDARLYSIWISMIPSCQTMPNYAKAELSAYKSGSSLAPPLPVLLLLKWGRGRDRTRQKSPKGSVMGRMLCHAVPWRNMRGNWKPGSPVSAFSDMIADRRQCQANASPEVIETQWGIQVNVKSKKLINLIYINIIQYQPI